MLDVGLVAGDVVSMELSMKESPVVLMPLGVCREEERMGRWRGSLIELGRVWV